MAGNYSKQRAICKHDNVYECLLTRMVPSFQSLMLPCLADSVNVRQEHLTAFSRMVSSWNVVPEEQEELPPLLDVLMGEL